MQCIKAKLDKLHDTEQFLSPDLLFACNWKKKSHPANDCSINFKTGIKTDDLEKSLVT